MPKLQWRPMTPDDLPAIDRLAEAIHPDFPEDAAIFAERLRLYPPGCWVLAGAGGPQGYAISHPWQASAPPALNTLLGTLPAPAEAYYLHDIALSPSARGGGHGGSIVGLLLAVAKQEGAGRLSLVAVNGSVPFWQRQGFEVREDAALAEKLASYGQDARFMTRGLAEGRLPSRTPPHPHS